MSTFDILNAKYNARKASGQDMTPNPFAGLFPQLGKKPDFSGLTGEGGTLGADIRAKMMANLAESPQYSGLGQPNGIPIRPDPISPNPDNSPQAMAQRVAVSQGRAPAVSGSPFGVLASDGTPDGLPPPANPMDTAQSVLDDLGIARLPESPKAPIEAPVSPTKKPETPQEAAVQEQQKEVKATGKTVLKAQGATKAEQGMWDKLNDKFDLTKLGLGLMATSGNGQSLGANLGAGVLAGMDAKVAEKDKAAAASQLAYENEMKQKLYELQYGEGQRAEDKNTREEALHPGVLTAQGIDSNLKKSQVNKTMAETTAIPERTKTDRIAAQAAATRAMAASTGTQPKYSSNATLKTSVLGDLAQLGIDETEAEAAVGPILQRTAEIEMDSRGTMSYDDAYSQAFAEVQQTRSGLQKDKGFFYDSPIGSNPRVR
jgi:hypothetical protein